MKKLLAILVITFVLFALVACDEDSNQEYEQEQAQELAPNGDEVYQSEAYQSSDEEETHYERFELGGTIISYDTIHITFHPSIEIVQFAGPIEVDGRITLRDSSGNPIETDKAIRIPVTFENVSDYRYGQAGISGVWGPHSIHLDRLRGDDYGNLGWELPSQALLAESDSSTDRLPRDIEPRDTIETYYWIPYVGAGQYRIGITRHGANMGTIASRTAAVYFSVD